MKANWKSVDAFLKEESKYRTIDKAAYEAFCKKYGFVKATSGWIGTKTIKSTPNVKNQKMHDSAMIPDIRNFFDHWYSFKTATGETYWVSCPYNYGWSKKQITDAFTANYLICDIVEPSFCGDYTIVMTPESLINACDDYVVSPIGNGRFAVYKVNRMLNKSFKRINDYDTSAEAEQARLDLLNDIFYKCSIFYGA